MPKPKPTQSEETRGAPEWMLTYSDCMTLLLTFFVMLITFSSFDDKVFRRMESVFAEGLNSLGLRRIRDNRAFRIIPPIVYHESLRKGSEQPTVAGEYDSNPSQSLDFMDFQDQKVFLLPSDKVFWGRGLRLSPFGCQLLSDIATLLEATSEKIVISEHTLGDHDNDADLGLRRAWQITRFLTEEDALDRARFSISSASTVAEEIITQTSLFTGRPSTTRVLEIVILERSIYH